MVSKCRRILLSRRCRRIIFLLLLCPVDPPTPEARNAVEDAAKIPREVYREQDIVHNNDDNDGDDGNNLHVSTPMPLRSGEEDIKVVAAVSALPLW